MSKELVRVGFLVVAPSSVETWANYFEWLLPALESMEEPDREREHRKDLRRVRYQLEALRAYQTGSPESSSKAGTY